MDEKQLRKDLEAIEAEKKAFLEGKEVDSLKDSEAEEYEEVEEEVETEETEFDLNASEIDEWINELTRLKEEKGTITLSVDDENDFKINYSEESEGDEE